MTIDDAEIPRLNAEADELLAVSRDLRVGVAMTPLNLREERDRSVAALRAARRFVPQFSYADESVRLEEISRRCDRLGRGDTEIDALVHSQAVDQVRDYQVAISHDAQQITELTTAAYGVPGRELIDLAWEIVEGSSSEADEVLSHSAESAAAELRKTLDHLGFESWIVKIDDTMHARMAVRSEDRLVRVRAGSRFSQLSLDRLRAHEIGTHVARFEHGNRSQLRAMRVPFGPNARTEEGLAVFSEFRAGLLSDRDLRRYALRVIATDVALTAGYAEVCEAISPHCDAVTTVDIAVRVKRGFRDPDQPGAHTKDISYLAGFEEMRQLTSVDRDALIDLLSCKQPVSNLPLVRRLLADGLLERPADPLAILGLVRAS